MIGQLSTKSGGLRRGEEGAVLIVSLLILLVLTVIGVVALNTGSFQEKMAFNTQERVAAFHAAESGIRSMMLDDPKFLEAITDPTPPKQAFGSYHGTVYSDSVTISSATLTYLNEFGALPEGYSVGDFVSHRFVITGEGRRLGSRALSINLQGAERIGPAPDTTSE
jgi:hypothetical protein